MDPEGSLLAFRLLSPELLEDPIRGDDAVGVEEEESEQRALLERPQVERLLCSHFERAEDSKVQEPPPCQPFGPEFP